MRTQLLCALALLCGAGVVHAQGWAAGGTNAYPPGYGQMAPAMGYPGNVVQAGLVDPNGYPNAGLAMGYVQDPNGNVGYGPVAPGAPVVDTGYGYPPFAGQPAPDQIVPQQPIVEGPVPGSGLLYMVNDPPRCPWQCWGTLDYMMSFLRRQHLNTPLFTVGAPGDVHPGALGQPGTGVLFKDSVDYDFFNGLRAELGTFCDDSRRWSVEWVGQFFGSSDLRFQKASDVLGNPVITRPVYNVVTNEPRAFITSFPGLAAGVGSVDANANMFSTEVNAGVLLCCGPCLRVDGIVGFRYMHLAETLSIRDDLTPLTNAAVTFRGVPLVLPASLGDLDQFRTRNNFYGGQIGAKYLWDGNLLFLSGYTKVGLGATTQAVDINGSTVLTTPTVTTVAAGGILALPSNIGHYTRTVVSVVPDAGLTIGLKITSHIQVTAGYSFLLWSNSVRPGRQIDPSINPSLVPTNATFGAGVGAARPRFPFDSEVVWMQSLMLGLSFRY